MTQSLLTEVALSLSSRRLHLIVMPTEQCSFRCTYCYERFTNGRMPRSVQDGIVSLIARRLDSLDVLQVEWFGGEPLVARRVVLDLSRRIQALVGERVAYTASMTTNGWRLDPETAAAMAAVGFGSIQVSLDGPREFHDRTRIRGSGAGTFDRIWRNLLAIRDSDLPLRPMLRLHLTPENARAMPAFVDELAETFLRDERFSVLLKPIEHLGGSRDGEFDILGHRDGTSLSAALSRRLEDRLGRDPSVAVPQVCYAGQANSLVIRSTGAVAKCTVALEDERNAIGHLSEDGRLRIDQRRLRPWLRGLKSLDLDVLGCPLVGLSRPEQVPVVAPAS